MRGFTLVELLISVAIMAILSAVALPNFSAWLANSQIRSVSEALQNDLRLAQSEAVKRNRIVALVLTNSTPTTASPGSTAATPARNWVIYALPLQNSDEGAASAAGSTRMVKAFTQENNSRTQVSLAARVVCFNSMGRLVTQTTGIADAGNVQCAAPAANAPLAFAIQNPSGNTNLSVQLTLGGQVRMCNPSKSISTSPDGCT